MKGCLKGPGNPRRGALLLLFSVTLIWGVGYLGVQGAIDAGLTTSAIMAGRFLLGAALIGALMRFRVSGGKNLLHGLAGGVLLYGGFYCQTAGQAMTTISDAAFLTAAYVVMIPLVHWALSGRRPRAKVFLCCLITVAGVAFISLDFERGLHIGAGGAVVLLGALFFALHMVYLGHAVRRYDAGSVTFWQLASAAAIGFLMMAAEQTPLSLSVIRRGLWPLLYSGFMATGLCYFLEGKAQKHISAAQTGVILSMDGVVAAVLSVALGYEAFRLQVLLGGIMITGAVVLMEAFPDREPRA